MLKIETMGLLAHWPWGVGRGQNAFKRWSYNYLRRRLWMKQIQVGSR